MRWLDPGTHRGESSDMHYGMHARAPVCAHACTRTQTHILAHTHAHNAGTQQVFILTSYVLSFSVWITYFFPAVKSHWISLLSLREHRFDEAGDIINRSLASCYNSSTCAEYKGCHAYYLFYFIFSVINKHYSGSCVCMPSWVNELHNDLWDTGAQSCVLTTALSVSSTEESQASFLTLQHFSFFINKMG